MEKTPEILSQEREQRIMDAIQLKTPDRVPVIAGMGYFPAKYCGITCETAYYDYDAWLGAYKKTLHDFQPDMVHLQGFSPGKALEYINPKGSRWPGHGVSPCHSHQTIEMESMKADEYAHFLNDTSDYMFRISLSRASDEMAGLAMLPKLSDLGTGAFGLQMLAAYLVKPEIAHAIELLQKAGEEIVKWRPKMMEFVQAIEKMGFPPYTQGFAMAPFDVISHSMRGMKGAITDMYRQPDNLLEACVRILDMTLKRPIGRPSKLGHVRVFMPLTRGSDDFMSLKQFETFYWPTLKKLILFLIDKGATPTIFFEGNFTSRLEYLLDLPKGKVLAHLDTTDIFRAKEILKDHICIKGNVPSSLLQVGTVQEVEDYCRRLIDIIGKGGGFILAPRGSTDEVKPENLMAMIEFAKKYGRY
jgi:uroporphyrinogen-III decarboxylase